MIQSLLETNIASEDQRHRIHSVALTGASDAALAAQMGFQGRAVSPLTQMEGWPSG